MARTCLLTDLTESSDLQRSAQVLICSAFFLPVIDCDPDRAGVDEPMWWLAVDTNLLDTTVETAESKFRHP